MKAARASTPRVPRRIISIYADDLGHGMLSCYGQRDAYLVTRLGW